MQPFDRLTVSFLEIAPWTGRFYALLDPSYAKNHIPIIASVSEHQPTAWSSFFFDFELLVFMFPGKIELLSLYAPSILTHTLSLAFSGNLLLLQRIDGRQYLHHHVWNDIHLLCRTSVSRSSKPHLRLSL